MYFQLSSENRTHALQCYNYSSLIYLPQQVQWLPSFSVQVSQTACPTPWSSERYHNSTIVSVNPVTAKDTQCTYTVTTSLALLFKE